MILAWNKSVLQEHVMDVSLQAAAVEKLEESKNKIEGLLDWISNIGNENENVLNHNDRISNENGNLPEQTAAKGILEENDDANGNAPQTTENDSGKETGDKSDASLDLDKQYERVKVRCDLFFGAVIFPPFDF